jgi:Helicase C-terminal domain/DEAD/DEAH box helicase
VPFKPVSSGPSTPAGPLELFDELPRRPGAIPELWRQQGEILSDYAERFAGRADVAVELPTGTGKTMVGLLIADWRRRKFRKPVLYACPTHQLVHQVAAVARREGMPCVTLIGSHIAWPAVDKSRYDGCDALGLTTYSSIFNAAPKVSSPGTIVFDDAHAGEQYVAEGWSVTIDRGRHNDAYLACLKAVRPALSAMFAERMEQPYADVRARMDVRLVVPLRRPKMAEAINQALGRLPNGSGPWWAWNTVRPGLASCLVYVAWREILIRPIIPPTSENEPFAGADQRVYLSATPGHAGELERSFGRRGVETLLLRDGRSPRSGRRFFVFADLAAGEADDLAAQITSAAGKALVLATSTEIARTVATTLNRAGWPVLGKDDVERSLDAFAGQQHAILALAGRYDGIDLPDDACRLVCLTGLPEWAHLQERFLASSMRARAALEERTRTRVVQGVGRATRNPSDHAIVLIRGNDLTRYLTSPVVREALDADLQAEVEFGLENSREVSAVDLLENVSIFLHQGDDWRDSAEPFIADARRKVMRQDPPGSALLAASAPHEVDACTAAFRSDFIGARDAAQRAASALSGDDAVRSFRAFWLYQAAVWSFAAAGSEPNATKTAVGLLKEAHSAAQGTTWLREAEAGTQSAVEEDADDTPGVREVAKRLRAGVKRAEIVAAVGRMRAGIAEIEHQKSEPAITELGRLLGAESFKPLGQGRADSAWCWDERVWIAIEAKSEQSPTGEVSLRDIRQANTQLVQLAGDRGVGIPALAAVVLASPRTVVADEAVTGARPEIHLTHPADIRVLAEDIASCWDKLLLTHYGHTGQDLDALVRKTMAEHQVLPTQVLERLTGSPIKS